jgi:Activator of Hsp90 ATPase homolog 1-like protein
MPNIIHRIGTEKATTQQLYEVVATAEGLRKWWTIHVNGEAKVGNILQFRFPKGGPDFEVLELTPIEKVEWKCVQGPKEWIDTHIEFNILNDSGETVLMFKHSGWREEVDFMHHCSTQWAYFLIGLRKFLETGEGTPFGKNLEPISRWSFPQLTE